MSCYLSKLCQCCQPKPAGVPLSECDNETTTQGDATLTNSLERQTSHAPSTSGGDDGGPSARYMAAKGEVFFWRNFAYEHEGHPFMRVTHDVNLEDVANVMQKEWKMRSPRIVLVVISNVAPLQTWKNRRQLENFRKGLIKAANTTDMWIITNGTNIGAAKVIGDAVHDELLRRQSLRCHKHPAQNAMSLPRLILVGVTRDDMLVYGDMLDGRSYRVEIENEGNRLDDNKFELNPDHSHYVVVKDDTVNKTGINYFVLRLEQYLSNTFDTSRQEEAGRMFPNPDICSLGTVEIPVVALLIQGGYDCARLVLEHLKKQLPVVVVRGTGGLADLLAFAYNEIKQREQGIWDAEFVENFLKPEISSKIAHHFPKIRDNNLARNIFRDRILECVRYSHQNQQVFLTILNMHSYSCNLNNMDEYLLRALFKSQKAEHTSNWHAQMQKDLYLTMDWNSPHVAMSEVFLKDPSSKFKVEKDVFEQALLRSGREDFVALFMAHGFQVHKYLTPRRLKQLFQRVQNQEFFQSVCWEGVLGHGLASKVGKNFIDSDLNWLIEHCTGLTNFVNSQELSLNAMGMYANNPTSAERKALTILTMWAVFTNRSKMAKLLWRFSDQPIHLALVVSMMYDRLTSYISETSLRTEMKDLSRQFADMATGVLDACYREATCRAYDVLSEESPDWKYKTAVDMAATARNRMFLSHPCCQKWLTNMFQGNIRIREVSWGVLTFPVWMKILLSAFLIAPMYIWVRFKTDTKTWNNFKDVSEIDSDDERDEHDGEEVELIHDKSPDGHIANAMGDDASKAHLSNHSGGRRAGGEHVATLLRDREVFVRSPPPLWKMVVLMWTAPVTKFWTSQIFYIFYLGLFSLAVLWPSCGNWALDVSVCGWTSLIVIEYIRRTYILYKKYTSVPLVFKCIEIMLIVTFVILYILSRILKFGVFLDPYNGKVLLCVGLLYFYYRLIAIYLPISPTLGPLLYRIRLMVLVDFMNFMRMTLLVIISGGIVIHAVLYPDFPVSSELFRRTFHKAWFSLYLTPIDDLQPNPRCYSQIAPPNETCRIGRFNDYTCPNTGLWPYIFAIQYFILLKLILLTLLYASFSATASKLEPEIENIWKFQRYQLVVDFANRLVLPAPLSIVSYLFIILKWCFRFLSCYCFKKHDEPDALRSTDLAKVQRLSEKDYDFWRQLAQDYSSMLEEKELESEIPKKQLEGITNITEEVEYEKKVLRQLKGRIRELERMITHSHVYLETIKHLAEKGEERGMHTQITVHILSRHSPYPQTRIQRFPVPDKYVPWEVMWIDYDPVAYTKPRSDFTNNLQDYVDEDILLLKEKSHSQQKLPVYHWNSISTNPAGITIDRQSWMTEADGSVVVYKLEEGVPRNPLGRTGLRGRGALPRWGPNHHIIIIITRWQRSRVAIGGGKGLEFVVQHFGRRDQLQLPGGFVPGDIIYEIVHSMFKSSDTTPWKTSDMMIEFFKSCCISHNGTPEVAEDEGAQPPPPNIKYEMIQRGYMDDPYNTDHAWREVELWHIHYQTLENLSEKMQLSLGWRLVTEDVFIKLPAGQAALLQEVTHRLQPAIL